MLRLLVIAAVAVAALASTLGTLELDSQWETFKDTYGKKYVEGEEFTRRLIWENNLQLIKRHNLKAERGLYTYILGENDFADMTHKEFVSLMNGYIEPTEESDDYDYIPTDEADDLPDSVDWRPKGYVTEVKNQKLCGSCWAFSATGSLEGQTFKKTGKLISLSEQNLIDCSKPEGDFGCLGGWPENAFKYVKQNGGIDTEESYPYKDHKHFTCHYDNANIGATVTGYVLMANGTEDKLQTAVANVGPISVAIDASSNKFQFYKSGIFSDPMCSTTELDHAVLVVGYGHSDEGEYWTVKNSWGTRWGMEGYFEMARNKNNMCGICSHASYPTV